MRLERSNYCRRLADSCNSRPILLLVDQTGKAADGTVMIRTLPKRPPPTFAHA